MKQLIINNVDEIGPQLRGIREEKHITRQQIAAKAGISKNTVFLTENGRGTPGIFILSCWARALGFDELVIKC